MLIGSSYKSSLINRNGLFGAFVLTKSRIGAIWDTFVILSATTKTNGLSSSQAYKDFFSFFSPPPYANSSLTKPLSRMRPLTNANWV